MEHNILVTLFIGLVAGFLAGKFLKGSGYGIFGDIAAGLVGGYVMNHLIIPHVSALAFMKNYGTIGDIVTATIGAVIVLFIVSLFSKK
jgi:uncharacterized membrane protein YeaQ/YmgE (transglycosylase-associated protein family)